MLPPLKRTPLNEAHREMGAKLIDFAGWEMPLSYGSQIEEHHSVRRDAGMFDVSHMLVLDVRGAGARDFLRFLLANNVERLREPGKALYSCMLNEEGGVLDDLIVYFLAEDWFRLVVNAGTAERDCAWIGAQRDRRARQLEIAPRRDLAMIAVQGPLAREKTWRALPDSRAATERLGAFCAAAWLDALIARTGYTGEDGFEIMLPGGKAAALWRALAAQGVAPAGLAARDTLRLEAGMNLYGQDMDEGTSPLESGLAWTVELGSLREFIGKQPLLARPVRCQLTGLVLLDRGVMRARQKVSTARGAGEITSGGFSPTLNRSIALARVPREVRPGDEVEVEVRDRRLHAKVVKPPFVRNGNVLINLEPRRTQSTQRT
ncbi:MAG: glycine cleavage system aminomethyltransferase GcvT [Betaproteobacteria bacterium]|nr:glycine cleavage system aminomethyltransferase GcvT [Betaproteobacteria bacterium]